MRVCFFLMFCCCCGLVGCAPASAERGSTTQEVDVGGWSDAVNGLEGRVEGKYGGRWEDQSVFVVFRNVGGRAIRFPNLRVLNQGADSPWRVEVKRGGEWKAVPWEEVKVLEDGVDPMKDAWEVIESGPAVTLRRGETVLVEIEFGGGFGFFRNAQEMRVVLSQGAGGAIKGWSGRLEIVGDLGRKVREPEGELDLPTYIPGFSHARQHGVSGSGTESDFELLEIANDRYQAELAKYRPEQVARALEGQLSQETDVYVKILVASEAAKRGSAIGREFLLGCRRNTDYAITRSACMGLWEVSRVEPVPEWVMRAMLEALADERETTNRPESMQGYGSFTMGRVANGAYLMSRFAELKYPAGAPLFLKWAQERESGRSQDAIWALGKAGDPRAIPVLLGMLKEGDGPPNAAILYALAELKAPGAAEMLFGQMHDAWTVELVEGLGDVRALPALRKIVADGRPAQVKGSTPDEDRRCVDAARLAIAALEPGDPVPRYCAMLDDAALAGTHHEALVRIFNAKEIDPVVVPTLLRTIRTTPEGYDAVIAIEALAKYRYKAAVAGLIDCFAVDFRRKSLPKMSGEEFEDAIAASLSELTGKRFGVDPGAWKAWWEAEGRGDGRLK